MINPDLNLNGNDCPQLREEVIESISHLKNLSEQIRQPKCPSVSMTSGDFSTNSSDDFSAVDLKVS